MIALAVGLFFQLAAAPPSPSIEGMWSGTLMNQLRLTLEVSRKPDGKLSGTMVSLDQGHGKMAIEEISVAAGAVKFVIPSVHGSFEGKLDASGAIVGTWTQAVPMPLTFRRGATPPAPTARPQDPKRPYPYDEVDVSYENVYGAVKLAATLTVPRGKGPFPAVVLITGSGAQNRNEEVMGHRTFLVLADYLTRRGFAVLRADDRGVGGSTGSVAQSTTTDFAWDALAGVAFLKTRKEIDAKRIGLVGHSEGGVVAPIAAAASKDVAFIVLMAGTGFDGAQIGLMQTALIDKVAGKPEAEIARSHAATERVLTLLGAGLDPPALEAKARALIRQAIADEGKTGGEAETLLDASLHEMLSPWFRAFVALDPTVALKKVRCPVLALGGERDLQVPPKENLRAIAEALKAGGNRDATTRELPGLNHLFQTAKTGLPTEYATIDETIAPIALQAIGDWLVAHARR
jgi:fermentation-respiration switch protein FrsA (DUF1100 family)